MKYTSDLFQHFLEEVEKFSSICQAAIDKEQTALSENEKAKEQAITSAKNRRKCGYALSLREYKRKYADTARYYVCARKYVAMTCDGIGAVPAEKSLSNAREDVPYLTNK